jgi:hypothetical protein
MMLVEYVAMMNAETATKTKAKANTAATADSATKRIFGVFATHSPESCPLNKAESREAFMQVESKLTPLLDRSGGRLVGFYMSVLEHQWTIILEAASAHDIEDMCIKSGISAFNTVKIVPLTDFKAVMSKLM